MIISASRRTDIPCFYSDWLIKRLEEGYALIPNPWNADRLGRVELSPRNVDCIVFWTKNPAPMMDRLSEIDRMGYDYYFQFTVTAYGRDIERNLPEKRELVESFKRLSEMLGPERVDWRFDPILKDLRYPPEKVSEFFENLCGKLHDYTERCIISFADDYSHGQNRAEPFRTEDMLDMAERISGIAGEYSLPVFSCSEEIDLGSFGIEHCCCIDQKKVERIIGSRISAKKDAGQRALCGCIESVDIGTYDTCCNGCVYCYATRSEKSAWQKRQNHDPGYPMLTGEPKGTEIISDRTGTSQKIHQLSLFD